MVKECNAGLITAFPSSVREDATAAVSALPETTHLACEFSVRVNSETVSIPQRIYHNPLDVSVLSRFGWRSQTKKEILDCLFTRHADGFVREERLRRVIRSNNIWIPPFVIQLAGEYIVEILRIIEQHLDTLDEALYSGFVQSNPQFIAKTKQRILSYWDCYYRLIPWREYPGFRIHTFLESLNKKARIAPGLELKAKS